MANLYLIQTGQTTFEERSRVESAAGAPLTAQGKTRMGELARQLGGHGVERVYASHGESEHQSARLLADMLGVKLRTAGNLREIDYGLWQGLTLVEIKRRQPKLYRQWTESPAMVCPPGGEAMSDAQHRLRQAVKGIIKRHKDSSPLLVLRPMAMALLRCALEGKDLQTVRQYVCCPATWLSYDTRAVRL